MPHAALPVGKQERRRRAVLNAPLKCSDRTLGWPVPTLKSARLLQPEAQAVMRVSRPQAVRETAGPGSMQLAPSLMRTLVRTCTS